MDRDSLRSSGEASVAALSAALRTLGFSATAMAFERGRITKAEALDHIRAHVPRYEAAARRSLASHEGCVEWLAKARAALEAPKDCEHGYKAAGGSFFCPACEVAEREIPYASPAAHAPSGAKRLYPKAV